MLAQTPIEIINRVLETVDNVFEICIKEADKIGSTSNVKAMLTENVDEKGLTGKEYICLLTKKVSKQVPIIAERKTVIIKARKSFFLSEEDIFLCENCKFNFFECFAVVF
ncbi:hypothetical protein IIQ_02570 [Bacillus cereus VD118]|uniref:Uncharacterized protein n=1 Tax=Bacillus cereus VD118 TaxID=1053231 RepID=R8Q4L2_BACCE|nr:hypothetical protein IIQ_02570 [Bacillus cereus VD118]